MYLIIMQEAMDHMEEMEMATSTSPPKNNVQPPLPSNMEPAEAAASTPCANLTPPSPENSRLDVQKNGHTIDNSKTAKVFEIQIMPNGKTRTSLKTMSRRKFSQQKEKKATQMLAIVLGKSLVQPPLWKLQVQHFTGFIDWQNRYLGEGGGTHNNTNKELHG